MKTFTYAAIAWMDHDIDKITYIGVGLNKLPHNGLTHKRIFQELESQLSEDVKEYFIGILNDRKSGIKHVIWDSDSPFFIDENDGDVLEIFLYKSFPDIQAFERIVKKVHAIHEIPSQNRCRTLQDRLSRMTI